jgi:hypothetical protein
MSEQPNATRAEYLQALYGVEFPASRDRIVQAARDKGGLDSEVMFILEHLPKDSYDTMQQLEGDVLRVYQKTGGGLDHGRPAAKPEPGERPDPAADPRRP